MTEQMEKYLELLIAANERMNLTAVRAPDEIRIRHFEDSLRLFDAYEFPHGASLIDVGTGAGFPGLTLKLARPDLRVTLLDATGKKVEFLREVCEKLELDGVTCLHGRAEELAHTALRESFDIVTARGVTAMPALCEICLPLVRVGGVMLAMKELPEPCECAGLFGGRALEPYVYTLTGGIRHAVVRVQKERPAPGHFPRTWAQIKRAGEAKLRG